MRTFAILAALAVLPGCDFFASDVPEGTLRYSPEGISGDRDFKVAAFEAFEFNSAEVVDTFEVRGSEAAITGKLWPNSQIGGDWTKLKGRVLTLTTRGGNPQDRVDSFAKIPEFGEKNVCAEGTDVEITNVTVEGGRTIISGRFRFSLETSKGQKRGNGLFKAVARSTAMNEPPGD